jgi:hypothetical protein
MMMATEFVSKPIVAIVQDRITSRKKSKPGWEDSLNFTRTSPWRSLSMGRVILLQ